MPSYMTLLRLVGLCVCMLPVWIAVAADAKEEDRVRLKLGKHLLELPRRNVRDGVPFWIELIPGLPSDQAGALLTVYADEVAREVQGYKERDGRYETDIRLRVEVLNERQLKRFGRSDAQYYLDIWFGTGMYENGVVEPYEETGFYRVRMEGSDVLWDALRMRPDASKPIPEDPFDFWVATCIHSNSSITTTGRFTRCSTRFVHEDLLLDFTIAGFNLHLIDEIKAMLVRKLLEWKVE